MKLVAILLGLVACANALEAEVSLKERIALSLESFAELENTQELGVEGVENCANKCNNVFNRMAYLVSTSGDPTFEYQACMKGCGQCTTDISKKAPKDNCFKYCKNFDWKGNNYLKGVIEPDKACIAGCIIQTCQGVCIGGTSVPQNNKNKALFWPNGGCAIKTEPYSQNQEYVPWNSPNTGQSGNEDIAACCGNALSLCLYSGDKASSNYAQLLQNTGRMCKKWVPSQGEPEICNVFYANPQNCGNL